jgi:SAM-dependent methyltransferase
MSSTPPILFDRARLRKRRQRASANFSQHDFLAREAATMLAESLDSIAYRFPRVAELGASGILAETIAKRPGTGMYVQCDLARGMLPGQGLRLVADEEYLPFAPESLDAIVSIDGLHWVNDLPGCFAQIHRALKPDGLFIAVMPGVETLRELRQVFAQTDAAQSGGITPRIAPFLDVRDAGGLLQRAGFALPVVDRDLLNVTYGNLFALLSDLRGSGQSNMLQQKLQHFTPRGYFMDAAKRYAENFSDSEGRLAATFELITLTAWKPAATQQQPAKRGSGKMSLKDALN